MTQSLQGGPALTCFTWCPGIQQNSKLELMSPEAKRPELRQLPHDALDQCRIRGPPKETAQNSLDAILRAVAVDASISNSPVPLWPPPLRAQEVPAKSGAALPAGPGTKLVESWAGAPLHHPTDTSSRNYLAAESEPEGDTPRVLPAGEELQSVANALSALESSAGSGVHSRVPMGQGTVHFTPSPTRSRKGFVGDLPTPSLTPSSRTFSGGYASPPRRVPAVSSNASTPAAARTRTPAAGPMSATLAGLDADLDELKHRLELMRGQSRMRAAHRWE